jgi:hypothetical protein
LGLPSSARRTARPRREGRPVHGLGDPPRGRHRSRTRTIVQHLTDAAGDLRSLGDLGYEGEAGSVTLAFKKSENAHLTLVQQQLNQAHNGIRAIGERGNALLKMTFKALRNVSVDPPRIGAIVAAALVLLHHRARTT